MGYKNKKSMNSIGVIIFIISVLIEFFIVFLYTPTSTTMEAEAREQEIIEIAEEISGGNFTLTLDTTVDLDGIFERKIDIYLLHDKTHDIEYIFTVNQDSGVDPAFSTAITPRYRRIESGRDIRITP